ncbi:MAG: helix-turn-helix transcriptional regulator [Bacillota bacterium]|nr:helix-turn-helix transcriptional regulator [Bacillota bacterium]
MTLFQERLQLLLDEKGIKPVELARATKISPATISKYLSDEGKDPSLSCALKIARYFNVTSEWLYGFSNNRNPFYEPKLIDVYKELDDTNKKALTDYAIFLLSKQKGDEESEDSNR